MTLEPTSRPKKIVVAGAGILGLWQAVTLSAAGHDVQVLEASSEPFTMAASRYAGAMLSPYCEADGSDPSVVELGLKALAIWRRVYSGLTANGTLVVAPPRDRAEVLRFSKLTRGHATLYPEALARLEPELSARFPVALYFADEAHMDPRHALDFLLDLATAQGAKIRTGVAYSAGTLGTDVVVVDCRGMGARSDLPALRGVRGERILVRAPEVRISRMVRLLHPRHPLYVVPWSDGVYMIGATVIESDDTGPVTVRSALDLLGAAYAVHPSFAEAEILDLGAGVRPALPHNMPSASVEGSVIRVNGAYRHGFLLAPLLAEAVADFLSTGKPHSELVRIV